MKNKLAKNSMALGLATLIVTAGLSFSANGAPAPVAQADASAVRGTGLFEALDGGTCEAVHPTGAATGRCGEGLDTNGIDAFSQRASAGADGVSRARASVAPINALDLQTTLDLTDLVEDLGEVETGTVLDPILTGLVGDGSVIGELLRTLLLPVTEAVDTVLNQALGAIDTSVPVTLRVGAVNASAEAAPGKATGESTVAGLDLVVTLGTEQIVVPVTLGTGVNADLLVGAPQDLVDGIIAGLSDTLTASLGGALGDLSPQLEALNAQLVGPLLEALEPTLLAGLSDALEPLVSGTVNKQVRTSTGELEVTALSLTLLGDNTLDLARVHVGPNRAGGAADDADGSTDPGADADADTDSAGDGGSAGDADSDGTGGADADADGASDADGQSDADGTQGLPDAGAPRNLLLALLLGLALLLSGAVVIINEKRRRLTS